MVFGIAIVLMLGIAALEGVMVILGGGLSQLFDALLPETLEVGGNIDADVDADIGSEGALSRLLGWLCLGRVPALVLLIIWLCAFGLSGYLFQAAAHAVSGSLIPGAIAWLPALIASLPMVRFCVQLLVKIIPHDYSEVVSIDSLVGQVAVIVTGTASQGQPAQARLKDQFGTTHYVMVEPAEAEHAFPSGTTVLLISRKGPWFSAIVPPTPHLTDPID
jgi:hypothetical protein